MSDISIYELSGKSSLLARGTADQILNKIRELQIDFDDPVAIDFKDVVAVAPSFFDQLLGGLKLKTPSRVSNPRTLRFLHMPAHSREKIAAIGRSHNMVLHCASEKEWLLIESDK